MKANIEPQVPVRAPPAGGFRPLPFCARAERMYEKPCLTRFGSFREITRGGSRSGNFDTSASNWVQFFFTGSPGTS
ncbi:MAG: lasso RiPP family leader peptide-containing protein [Gemmatimonadales bacterium]|nr:MAG: lasso RiPP family leader peptide-containing protein [Gemmatimonadales bacterium]